MDMTWTVPVAIIIAGAAYAIVARLLTHRERLAASPSDAGDDE